MERREIHRQALRAAAKVALSVSMLGCGAGEETAHDEPTSGRAEATRGAGEGGGGSCASALPVLAMPSTNPSGPRPDPGAGCAIPDAPPYAGETLRCCRAAARSLLDENGWPAVPPPADVDDATLACCSLVVDAVDGQFERSWSGGAPVRAEQVFSWQDAQGCCEVLGWPMGPTCTPWGPPAPPAMRRPARLEEVA